MYKCVEPNLLCEQRFIVSPLQTINIQPNKPALKLEAKTLASGMICSNIWKSVLGYATEHRPLAK